VADAWHARTELALQRHGHKAGADEHLRRPHSGKPPYDVIGIRLNQRALIYLDRMVLHLRRVEAVVGSQ
jgi:hypothetical protein